MQVVEAEVIEFHFESIGTSDSSSDVVMSAGGHCMESATNQERKKRMLQIVIGIRKQ